jgi:uncharacterized membrane protein
VGLFSIFRKRFFSAGEEKKVVDAIRLAESGSSGEVRVHFSKRIHKDILSDAQATFNRLEMFKTERRNGVLIYVVPGKKQFAIIGDEGFHKIAGDDFWQSVKDKMQDFFRHGNFVEGMTTGLAEVGEILKKHFPRQDNDTNELQDEISYGK